jgi:hypothetical protein
MKKLSIGIMGCLMFQIFLSITQDHIAKDLMSNMLNLDQEYFFMYLSY